MPRLSALVVAAVAALAAAAPAPAGAPLAGVLVPGQRLGGLELGATERQVERAWGRAYGECPNCTRKTWYFNFYAYQPRGAAVELERGRVTAIFTVYRPLGWRTRDGVALGDPVATLTARHPTLARVQCPGYYALLLPSRNVTAFYVLGERLWAFALQRPQAPVCR